MQEQVIDSEFGGGRSRRRVQLTLPHYVDLLRMQFWLGFSRSSGRAALESIP